MNYTYKKKNTFLVSILLFISCVQPVHASEPVSLFFNNKLNSEWLKKNKLYIGGVTGGTLLLGGFLYWYFRSNNTPKEEQSPNPTVEKKNDYNKVNQEGFKSPKFVQSNPNKQEDKVNPKVFVQLIDDSQKKIVVLNSDQIMKAIDNPNSKQELKKQVDLNKDNDTDSKTISLDFPKLTMSPVIVDRIDLNIKKLVDRIDLNDSENKQLQGNVEHTDGDLSETLTVARPWWETHGYNREVSIKKPTDSISLSFTPSNTDLQSQANFKFDIPRINNNSTEGFVFKGQQEQEKDNSVQIEPKQNLIQIFDEQEPVKKEPGIIIKNKYAGEINPTTIEKLCEVAESKSNEELLKTYADLCTNSNNFFGDLSEKFKYPNRIDLFPEHACKNHLKDKTTLENIKIQMAKDALMTHAFLDEKTLILITAIIALKASHEGSRHKEFFKKYVNREYDYINRLLTKRPIAFWKKSLNNLNDVEAGVYDKKSFSLTYGTFPQEDIQVDYFIEDRMDEEILENFISYDEMLLSARLGISSSTYLINKGHRTNSCEYDPQIERFSYCGLVGCRFERLEKNERQHMIIESTQNTIENGYGKIDPNKSLTLKQALLAIWARFYSITHFPTYNEAKENVNNLYIKLSPAGEDTEDLNPLYFHRLVYAERMKDVIAPSLFDANAYGDIIKKLVYFQAIGLGTGTWSDIKIGDVIYKPENITMAKLLEQDQIKYYACTLFYLLKNSSDCKISDIDFSWWVTSTVEIKNIFDNHNNFNFTINEPEKNEKESFFDICTQNNHTVRIHLSKRDPGEKLAPEHAHKWVYSLYAWDSNAYPGNEYFNGKWGATGDAAAASCSMISFLQNPSINPGGCGNIVVYQISANL